MSDGDVSLIRDEDVLRRLWQQTEDFSRKKEIRAHMYRLREERLRNLYSPEPSGDGKDLKALSNAGWNVEQENRTTDDGHTHVKSVNANIEGKYDVDGGKGQFAAVDHHKEAITEYQDDNSSLKRNETSSNTAAREHVVRQTDDGTQISSTSSSSTSTSKFQQVSSTRHDTVPYVTNDDYDLRHNDNYDTNRNEQVIRTRVTNTSDNEQNLRNDSGNGDLVSRKVEYPDDNTRVIVETRCLPDGTRVTSTRREFRAPVQSTRSEHSYQTRENKSYSTQRRTDSKESISRINKHSVEDRSSDIVDSQRYSDENDFKNQLKNYVSTDKDDYSNVQVKVNKKETNSIVNDSHVTRNETRTNKIIESADNVDYVKSHHSTIQQHYQTDDDHRQTIKTSHNRREVIETEDDYYKKDHSIRSDDISPYDKTNPREPSTLKSDPRTKTTPQYDERAPREPSPSKSNVPRKETTNINTENITNRDVSVDKDTSVRNVTNIREKTNDIKIEKQFEEIVEKKTNSDQYHTTYKTDFTQKRISNDWSPTHQAWASTLRADTPPTTRPSTRASSPGSKTFKSSTSSLRSSVSPDKTYRKPSSRGGSPSKVDRFSPTRTISDKYSSTQSTHSVTETRTHKHTSTEDKRPPTGRSPTRPGYSPERKPHDRQQRPSVSPDKKLHDGSPRSNSSPDRKLQKDYPRDYPSESGHSPSSNPTGLRQSPDRKPVFNSPDRKNKREPNKQHDASPIRTTSPDKTPSVDLKNTPSKRATPSPDRKSPMQYKPGYTSNTPNDSSPEKNIPSPDIPGYMRPTAASKQQDDDNKPVKPDLDTQKTTSQVKKDHYKFIDEETKMYTKYDDKYPNDDDEYVKHSINNKNPVTADDNTPILKKRDSRSPSPKHKMVTNEVHTSTKTTSNMNDETQITKMSISNKKDDTVVTSGLRQSSPSKYGTYDKKKPYDDIPDVISDKPTQYAANNSTTRDKSPKVNVNKSTPRSSVSPTKSPIKDTKNNFTADFIKNEQKTEEINKQTTKTRSRQLTTPSSSPTRKPKHVEPEPSTGQSSPTTSVSGFVYFGSPRPEESTVTDLDDENNYTDTLSDDDANVVSSKRPETLDIKSSPSPSKIPCRSPTPEKRVSPSKDSLPRKSSLKKPTDLTRESPVEKPPTSFQVSPVDGPKDVSGHRIIKKDRPEQSETELPIKEKPPLERRETYEDRCRKILGMTDTTEVNETKTTSFPKEPIKTPKSTSESPCHSPTPRESPFTYLTEKKTTDTSINVTEFISREQENNLKTAIHHKDIQHHKQSPKTRETSPTKLIHSPKNQRHESPNKNSARDVQSPPKDNTCDTQESPINYNSQNPEDLGTSRKSPPRRYSSNNSPRDSLSPERKQKDTPRRVSPEKSVKLDNITVTEDITTVESERQNSIVNKDSRKPSSEPGYMKSTTSFTSKYDVKNEDIASINSTDIEHVSKITDTSVNTPIVNEMIEISPSPEKELTDSHPKHIPGYMKATNSVASKIHTVSRAEDTEKSVTRKSSTQITDQKSDKKPVQKPSRESSPEKSPTHFLPKEKITERVHKHETSPTRTSYDISEDVPQEKLDCRKNINESPKSEEHIKEKSPSRKVGSGSPTRHHITEQTHSVATDMTENKHKPRNIDAQPSSPRKSSPEKYSNTTTATRTSSNLDDLDTITVREIKTNKTQHKITKETIPQYSKGTNDQSPERSATRKQPSDRTSPERKTKETAPAQQKLDQSPKSKAKSHYTSPTRQDKESQNKLQTSQTNLGKTPNYTKTSASTITRQETYDIKTSDNTDVCTEITEKYSRSRSSESPQRHNEPSSTKLPEEPRQLRTPNQIRRIGNNTNENTEFIVSEREQEVLDRVQKSLRKLSPERKQRSPSREKSPAKNTASLLDLDITTHTVDDDEYNISQEEITEIKITDKTKVIRSETPKEKPSEQKGPIKSIPRTVSPTKKPLSPSKPEKRPTSPTKVRSTSPKKPVSPTERPQSPQVPKSSTPKPKETVTSHLTRKPTPISLPTTNLEKTVNEVKKTSNVKQNTFNKTTTIKTSTKGHTSPAGKEPAEPRRVPTPKNYKEVPQRSNDSKFTRTTSDVTIKSKNTSPQRMKSKPEIKVSDMSTIKTTIIRTHKSTPKDTPLPSKPKSATTLNTSMDDDDDIIIDVELSKSSRENSPDRICPTPVNLQDDISSPRFPDEVKEPDDEFHKRIHHTIHETESLVDDIVEICEDDELFVRKTDTDRVPERENLLLNIRAKSPDHKITRESKPKDAATTFRDTEKRVHSDFIEDRFKNDECLLSVSEKVNKFAKGPQDDSKDMNVPTRRVTDEYDKNTTYQDDYTKLSVHDKAHLFVETAEKVKSPKVKSTPQKVDRPDLTNVDESLKSDDCLLSVSDKVNKFVKTAEQLFTESHEVDEKEKKIKEQHDRIIKTIVDNFDEEDQKEDTTIDEDVEKINKNQEPEHKDDHPEFTKETATSHAKVKEPIKPHLKQTERTPSVKITTLRSSEAVKKAKALFENIATTTQTKKETTNKKTKLTDIGVIKKAPQVHTAVVKHPSSEDSPIDESETDGPKLNRHRPSSETSTRSQQTISDEKPRSSPTRQTAQSPEGPRSKTPLHNAVEQSTVTIKSSVSRQPTHERAESPKSRLETQHEKENVPGYLRPTKTSQNKEETKIVENTEVSSRRGSGKFGVELRRTSVERSTASSERRRSVEHPCIEDIFDLDLLEQMLEKVVGYEQRRRIRAQIRVAKKVTETEHIVNTHTNITKQNILQRNKSPQHPRTGSPDRVQKATQKNTLSPERQSKGTPSKSVPEHTQPKDGKPFVNGHSQEPSKTIADKQTRPHSPAKLASTLVTKNKSPVRQSSPDKKTRTQSPSKTVVSKPKTNRFNEYASAYMKKVGLTDAEKAKLSEAKTKKVVDNKHKSTKHVEEHKIVEEYSTTRSVTQRTSSKDVIEVVQVNGKSSPIVQTRLSPERKSQSPERKPQSPERKPQSPERQSQSLERKAQSPERKATSPVRKPQNTERLYQRTPSPEFKRPTSDSSKKETIIKTVIEKKLPQKPAQEDKPSWVTNRNLKKITSETRTFSSKKIEEKPKYRPASPSKVITKPIDVITSSYGPGPLDADGKPLFGIKALRNGGSNYQVKGTVIRQEYHSRNGGEPEGSVSVTAYSSEPAELERLLQVQGAPPSRIHGLSAITTTKKFGGETGTTLREVHGKDDRLALDQFTHSDRKVTETSVGQFTEDNFDQEEIERLDSRQEELDDRRFDSSKRTRIVETREEGVGDTKDRKENTQRKVERVVEKKSQKMDSRERLKKTEDKKVVRQSSVKSLTEKYIKSANESSKAERATYPKAGLILRTATLKDSVSSDSSAHAGLARTDSEHSLGSVEDTVVTTTTEECDGGMRTVTTTRTTSSHGTRDKSFLDSSTKVSGVQDILTRMKNADIVIQEGDTTEDTEARALLNKFLGATVLMAGMQSYVTEKPSGKVVVKETVRRSGQESSSQRLVEDIDLEQCWDERVLRQLLEECTDYEQRRRIRARIRSLMAEQEACASAVTEALAAAGEVTEGDGSAREEEEVTVTSSVRRNSSEKTVSSSTTTTKTSKVIESMTRPAPKPVSPFAKFRQLEKQNSTNSPKM